MFFKNCFRKCFDKNKKVKTKNKMATKTFAMNKNRERPRDKNPGAQKCYHNFYKTEIAKPETWRAKTVACKMFRNKMQVATKNGKNAKMAKMAKPGRGGGGPRYLIKG